VVPYIGRGLRLSLWCCPVGILRSPVLDFFVLSGCLVLCVDGWLALASPHWRVVPHLPPTPLPFRPRLPPRHSPPYTAPPPPHSPHPLGPPAPASRFCALPRPVPLPRSSPPRPPMPRRRLTRCPAESPRPWLPPDGFFFSRSYVSGSCLVRFLCVCTLLS